MSGTYENAPRCDKMLGNNQTAVLNSNPRKDGKENSKWAPLVWLDDKELYSISKELYPIQKHMYKVRKMESANRNENGFSFEGNDGVFEFEFQSDCIILNLNLILIRNLLNNFNFKKQLYWKFFEFYFDYKITISNPKFIYFIT